MQPPRVVPVKDGRRPQTRPHWSNKTRFLQSQPLRSPSLTSRCRRLVKSRNRRWDRRAPTSLTSVRGLGISERRAGRQSEELRPDTLQSFPVRSPIIEIATIEAVQVWLSVKRSLTPTLENTSTAHKDLCLWSRHVPGLSNSLRRQVAAQLSASSSRTKLCQNLTETNYLMSKVVLIRSAPSMWVSLVSIWTKGKVKVDLITKWLTRYQKINDSYLAGLSNCLMNPKSNLNQLWNQLHPIEK